MVESGVRGERENASWRYQAVTKDPFNPHRVRIACRDGEEHKMVKRMMEVNLVRGAQILRDDIFRIRVDGVPRNGHKRWCNITWMISFFSVSYYKYATLDVRFTGSKLTSLV